MRRPLAILAGLVTLLALADFLLAGRESRARDVRGSVGPLFAPDEAAELRKLPGLRVELAGETHSYGRIAGRWRCLSLHQAPADGRALQALIDGIVQAEGLVFARTVAEAPAYGINVPATIRVSLQGPRATQDPGGDVRATLELGLAQPGREACFVRKRGTKEIWSVAGDLRGALERRLAPGLPPLLAPAAVPEEWRESGGSVRVTVARAGGGFVLERRDRPPELLAPDQAPLDPATMQASGLPWTWILDPAGSATELDTEVAGAFVDFVENLPYAAVLDPARRSEVGLDAPRVTVRLEARSGTPLELVLGADEASGRVALWVAATETLYALDAGVAALLAPDPAELTAAREGEPGSDPWSAALRAGTAR